MNLVTCDFCKEEKPYLFRFKSNYSLSKSYIDAYICPKCSVEYLQAEINYIIEDSKEYNDFIQQKHQEKNG